MMPICIWHTPYGKALFERRVSQRLRIVLARLDIGWLNGSVPMIEPATAVAISQRKNSWPMCQTSLTLIRATARPARSSASTAQRRDGSICPSSSR
ncbi:hypothetical protein ACVW0I_006064 [Bradyrhizobium sp. LM6.11]